MTKRKLSDQQKRRISDRHERRAARAEAASDAPDDAALGPEQQGLVLAHFGRQADIEGAGGAVARCYLRANIAPLVAGDQVVFRAALTANEPGVVVACLPRATVLARPDSHSGEPKPVAANLDRIGIVIAPQPQPFANLIDRYLVAAESAGIAPFLVLNKCDLLDDASPQEKDRREQEKDRRAPIDALLHEYRAIGYPVIHTSSRRSDGLDALKAHLRGHVCVFVGQSGVGKSSLISALLPDEDIRVGALSEAESKGRHTTTTARLFHLDGDLAGSDLIDSPGIREFGLDHLDRAQVEAGFIELRDWIGRCRFRDCHHQQEPGCVLPEALASGAISAARLASFRALCDAAEN
jgi:ribosome biogenesis GTPase